MANNILIVGATSAIAIACARKWLEGETVFYLVGRNGDRLGQVASDLAARGALVHTNMLDLNTFDRHSAMLDDCFSKLGRVDIVLVAHGTLPDQPACEQDPKLAIREFSGNGLSVIALLTDLANRMEAQKSGCIAVISSVAGDRGRASNYLYGAAKSAVTVFCSGLRGRLSRSGVQVLTIKPGFVDTPMTQGLALPKLLLATPDKVATDIVKAVDRRRDTLYTPWFWRFIMLIIIHIPNAIFKRMSL
jgi:decaprenylphospho-beta-D-erythro-pentofuranosid-2-ulose 2-reductase